MFAVPCTLTDRELPARDGVTVIVEEAELVTVGDEEEAGRGDAPMREHRVADAHGERACTTTARGSNANNASWRVV